VNTELGYGLRCDAPEETVRATSRAAEEAGFRTYWLNFLPGTDGFRPVSWAAEESSRIWLGSGVIPLSNRSPVEILQGVAAAGLPRERYRLGIGSGSGPRPLARVREALRELRPKAGCELVVAALGPKMCELAGREADAVLLNMLTPKEAERSARLVLDAAEAAGRPRPGVYAYVRVALGEESKARWEQEAAMYARIPAYAANFERMGVATIDTGIVADTPEQVREGLRAWKGVVDEVVVRALPAHDRPDEALAILEAAAGT
jgi:alkanesulfonate monooxygenase SsuD/methylene tetrahydromethanopterin reductase-like flavin-dependent oxidoreductase (luciferase family)